MRKTECIIMIGVPGSGKSTICETYRNQGYEVISSDAIRKE